jgi:hypothetical protein
MPFEPAGIIQRLLEGLTVMLVEYAVSPSEHPGALLLETRAESVDVASDFDLLAQRQILDAPNDGLDHSHLAVNKAAKVEHARLDSDNKHDGPM